jgi:hypothetical protein
MSALLLTTVLGFTALSVDIGVTRLARTQLQTAVDAAAISGAQELDGTADGIALAEARAIEFAAYNTVLAVPVELTAAEVEVGTFDVATQLFTAWDGGEDPATVNAVRINETAAPVLPFLARVALDVGLLDVQATSLALRPLAAGPAGATECFLPFAIPDCHLAGLPAGTNPDVFKFTFAPTPTDSISWGDPDQNPNTNEVRNQLTGMCDQGEIAVGDPMHVNEGNHTSAIQKLADILNEATAVEVVPWDAALYGPMPARDGVSANTAAQSAVTAANWGNTLQGVVAFVDGGDDCDNVSFTGEIPITGFAWAVIYDVKQSGSNKNVWMQLDVNAEHQIWGDVDESAVGDNVLGVGAASLGGE